MDTARRSRLARFREIQHRYRPTRQEVERVVRDAVNDLPGEFRARLANVAIVVEAWPPGGPGAKTADLLLGLYQGTPLGQRGGDYHLAVPDRITIYSGPILAAWHTRAEVVRELRATVVHEIGHYFGLDDDELD
jgi:predicted Zn-dependent protease with MMP-like domain